MTSARSKRGFEQYPRETFLEELQEFKQRIVPILGEYGVKLKHMTTNSEVNHYMEIGYAEPGHARGQEAFMPAPGEVKEGLASYYFFASALISETDNGVRLSYEPAKVRGYHVDVRKETEGTVIYDFHSHEISLDTSLTRNVIRVTDNPSARREIYKRYSDEFLLDEEVINMYPHRRRRLEIPGEATKLAFEPMEALVQVTLDNMISSPYLQPGYKLDD